MRGIHLNLKLFGLDSEEIEAISRLNLKMQITNKHVLVFLEEFNETWPIPEEINLNKRFIVYTQITEFGGFSSSGPYARIVCSRVGSKIRSFHVPFNREPLGNHAYFAGDYTMIGIECYGYKEIVIFEYRSYVNKIKRMGYCEEKVLFAGDPRVISDLYFNTFGEAINTLLIKAHCHNCTHVHYCSREL